MAKISVIGTPFNRVLLQDLSKKQSLREQTLYPTGQERYINPINVESLRGQLANLSGGAVSQAEAQAVIDGTVGADDISLDALATVAVAAVGSMVAGDIASEEQRQSVQDLLCITLIETGQFQLSFDRGVISKLAELGWIKVFTKEGDALYTL